MTDLQPAPTGRRARGGADARRAARTNQIVPPAGFIRRKIKTYEPFSDDQLELIEHNAETVLQETGIDLYEDEEAVQMWKQAGADVNTQKPIPSASASLSQGPRPLTDHDRAARIPAARARNPAHHISIGGNNTVFAPVYGPPFIRNLDEGRRYATIEDFRNFSKPVYMLPSLIMPVERYASRSTIRSPSATSTWSTPTSNTTISRSWAQSPRGSAQRIWSPWRELLFGKEFVDQNCVMTSLINANSPMVWDGVMLGALKVYARANQATVISPFIVVGAMSPVTTVGTLTRFWRKHGWHCLHAIVPAEVLEVVFGTFAASMSMQSGAPTFGTPEPALVTFGAAQLARRMGVPSPAVACAAPRSRTHRQPTKAPTRCGRRSSPASTSASTQRAGWKADWHPVTRNSSWMPTNSPCSRSSPKASISRKTARPWMPSASWPRFALSGLRPHARQFRNCLLALRSCRQQFVRAMAGRGRKGHRGPRQHPVEKDARRRRGPSP